eukprot:CAMPEP_0184738188 /NCGR_PEP_ID=MMETSP0315-20130426/910_1 /TAXON_ID=101924 /ORGANISM="Rhodosorus marinus, Strain UTEX LB 2760" /LENGTH=204 /DNA_ID=CAMNT_0027205805 /DNA_START=192 /DNA_END=806 /DNA_ORIENTATION=+
MVEQVEINLPTGVSENPQKRRRLSQERFVAVGQRIEVKWDLDDENGFVRSRWWGAKVLRKLESSGDKNITCDILYDPFEDFAETQCRIVFQSSTELRDSDSGELLYWRAEGENSEPQSTTMVELQEEQDAIDRELGESFEQEAMAEFDKLPMEKQRHLAASYRSFADSLKEHLRKLLAANGANYEVRDNDIQRVCKAIKVEKKG